MTGMGKPRKSRIVPPDDLETFDRRKPPPDVQPWVTRSKSGYFTFNPAAYEALGAPEAVEYLYSPSTKILGFRPADPESLHSYPVYNQGNSRNYQSSAGAFNRHYGLEPKRALRYQAELIGDTLYIDLRDREALPVGRNGRTPQAGETEAE